MSQQLASTLALAFTSTAGWLPPHVVRPFAHNTPNKLTTGAGNGHANQHTEPAGIAHTNSIGHAAAVAGAFAPSRPTAFAILVADSVIAQHRADERGIMVIDRRGGSLAVAQAGKLPAASADADGTFVASAAAVTRAASSAVGCALATAAMATYCAAAATIDGIATGGAVVGGAIVGRAATTAAARA